MVKNACENKKKSYKNHDFGGNQEIIVFCFEQLLLDGRTEPSHRPFVKCACFSRSFYLTIHALIYAGSSLLLTTTNLTKLDCFFKAQILISFPDVQLQIDLLFLFGNFRNYFNSDVFARWRRNPERYPEAEADSRIQRKFGNGFRESSLQRKFGIGFRESSIQRPDEEEATDGEQLHRCSLRAGR